MGTTIMFHLAIERPDYVETNISTFIAIGPVFIPANTRAPIVRSIMPI